MNNPEILLAAVHPVGGTPALVLYGAIAMLMLRLGIPAISAFFREFKFYSACGWDFNQDSGIQIYRQSDYVRLFGFLPLGVIKLLYHFSLFAVATIFLAFPLAAFLH
jgi:hypothetical protein